MKSILVTGGSGSFGQAFTRHILNNHKIERIAIYSRGEHLQEEMERKFNDDRLRFFIGDVRDLGRLEMAMRGVDTVIHAAALKIVPTAEYNPTECIATNVTGAENVIRAALRTSVSRVVALSTDKAVNPINLYGASKLAAEKIFIAANAMAAGKCRFNVVRYGNVSGSRGSVLPLFQKLKAEGKTLKVTDERMTRFWITLDQSIDLVMNALEISDEGFHSKILVPKIPSIRIIDLAHAVHGNDGGTVEFNTGIRPGEKLHETLITEDESVTTTMGIGLKGETYYCINPSGYIKRQYETLVMSGWRYSSDSNSQWLTVEQLKDLV
jgi:UDP-N-acetylglucosamine 4,6-dehydratase